MTKLKVKAHEANDFKVVNEFKKSLFALTMNR